jgi:Nrap protein domain 1
MSEWLGKFDLKIPLTFSKMSKTFQFLPPIVIQPVGSYSSNTLLIKSTKSISIIVDLLVEIPHICVHKKDYLNNQYTEKRAIYLCYLAKKLRYPKEFSHLNDTTDHQPVLLVRPTGR